MKPTTLVQSCYSVMLLMIVSCGEPTNFTSASKPVAAPNVLFIPAPTADLSAIQLEYLRSLRADRATTNIRTFKIDPTVLKQDLMTIELETNLWVKVRPANEKVLDVIELKNNVDEDTESTLTIRDGNCTGVVRTKKKLFLIRPLGGSLHAFIEQDASRFPPDHPEEFERRVQKAAPGPKPKDDPRKDEAPKGEIVIIRVLVAHTTAVSKKYALVRGLIDSAVMQTNRAFQQSGVLVAVEVPAVVEVSYKESGSQSSDLDRLVAKNDGFMDEVHQLRKTNKADIVVLLLDSPEYGGYSARIMADADTAFAVVHHSAADANLSFAHEIGHLMGARHNPESDPSTVPFAYGHGYCNAAKGWRTIMSYEVDKECPRVARWSNPKQSIGGDPTGIGDVHDNARVLNETRRTVSGFRN